MRDTPRTRPAKAALSYDAVIDAGLRVLQERGIEGVTMRAVAQELDTGAASLYVYVASRRELLNQMFDQVAGEVDLGDEADPARWREQVEQLLISVLETMNRYPGIARVPLANVPQGTNALVIADRLISLLRAGGVDARSAAWFVDIVFLFVNATAYETAIYVRDGSDSGATAAELEAYFNHVDPGRYPHIASLGPLLTAGDGDQRFRFALRLMIEGLLHATPPDIP
jgi:AcrR family transcriptional regulator